MKYLRLYDNLSLIFNICGAITQEQAVRFFGDKETEDNIRYYLKKLSRESLVFYDEKADTLYWKGAGGESKDTLKRRLYAFWVVVAVGSDNLREIDVATYPSQLFFITNDGKAFDVTYVKARVDAQLAMRERNFSFVEGYADEINHVAVIRSPKEAEEFHLKEYGFDTYCIYDSDHVPHYTSLRDNVSA